MKNILSLLVAFVFVQTQCWALSGGPHYGGNTTAVSGTYAGVFTGISSTAAPVAGAVPGANSLGVFVIGVPITDLARGSIALFAEGVFYQGGIFAIVDPNKQKLSGIAQMVHLASVDSSTTSLAFTYDSRADGTIEAEISSDASQSGSTAGTTLSGTGLFTVANLSLVDFSFNPSGTLSFTVEGFKQSNEVIFPSNSVADLLTGKK